MCEVYAADYACFGYKRPNHCAPEGSTIGTGSTFFGSNVDSLVQAEARETPTQSDAESPLPGEAATEGNYSVAPALAAADALFLAPNTNIAPTDSRA